MPCVPGTRTCECKVPSARRVDRAPAGRNVPCPILYLGLFFEGCILSDMLGAESICHAPRVSAAIVVLQLESKNKKEIRMPCVPGTTTQEREVPGARRVDRAPAGRNVPCPI